MQCRPIRCLKCKFTIHVHLEGKTGEWFVTILDKLHAQEVNIHPTKEQDLGTLSEIRRCWAKCVS